MARFGHGERTCARISSDSQRASPGRSTRATGSEAHAAEMDRHLANMRDAFMTLPLPIPGTTYGKAIAGRKRMDEIIGDALDKHVGGSYDDIVSRMIDAANDADVPIDTSGATSAT